MQNPIIVYSVQGATKQQKALIDRTIEQILPALNLKISQDVNLTIDVGEFDTSGMIYEGEYDDGYWFTLELVSDDQLLEAVMHEMKHVEQVLSGRMSYDNEGNIFWEGVRYDGYYETPWEIEAYQFEESLNGSNARHVGSSNQSSTDF